MTARKRLLEALGKALGGTTTVIVAMPTVAAWRQAINELCHTPNALPTYARIDATNGSIYLWPQGTLKFVAFEHESWDPELKRVRGYPPETEVYVIGETK